MLRSLTEILSSFVFSLPALNPFIDSVYLPRSKPIILLFPFDLPLYCFMSQSLLFSQPITNNLSGNYPVPAEERLKLSVLYEEKKKEERRVKTSTRKQYDWT